jgi:serralysin
MAALAPILTQGDFRMPRLGQNYFASRLFADYASADSAFGDTFSFRSGAGMFQTAGAVTAFKSGLPDNYQPVESAWYIPGPTALIDVYTPNKNTTGTLVVDGAHVIASSDTPGDNDWFAVTLTAGQTYQFGQYAYVGGIPGSEGNGIPLADAYLEIYDSTGNNLLAIADGGGPNTPSGLDALMTFVAPYSGTFYVNATSYDNDGDGVGDFAGDYEIFARTATGTTYTTHYDISSPLHSIDWGGVLVNREHVAVRNPDGNDGPRPTGEPAADPASVTGNALGYPGKNVIYIYFAGEGDLYANADSTIPAQVTAQDPYQYEIQAVLTAAAEFSKVADVVFVSNYTLNPTTHLYERDPTIVYKPGPLGPEAGMKYATGVDGDGFDADFFYWSYPGTPGPGISLLGSMNPPDYGDEGVAQFNSADERWSAQMLQQGGFSFVTLIHEFGHGMGLAHPHDTGGGSSVMQGVQTNGVPGDDGGAGAYDLNQGVNTMMSYNDGWEKSPYGQAETNNEGYGWLGGLMALDIAVIQDKYGVNEDWATGNDTYVLKDVNEWGVYIDAATGQPAQHDATNAATSRDGYYVGQSTYYSSIWDAGGVDQIVYNGARDTNIDLRPATLRYEYGGAGWMSYATGIYGGFTIANGVTIENATSGGGNDKLIGNNVGNRLDGGGGSDTLIAGTGTDTLLGGDGNDVLYFGGDFAGADLADGGAGRDVLVLQGSQTVFFGEASLAGIESVSVQSGANAKWGDTANNFYDYKVVMTNSNVPAGVQLIVNGQSLRATEDFTFDGSAETDASFLVYGGHGVDLLTGGAGDDIFFFEGARWGSADTVNGNGGRDAIIISSGTGVNHFEFTDTSFTSIEAISVNNRYTTDPSQKPSYELVLANGNVAAGATLILNGSSITDATQFVSFDGHLVQNGNLTMLGGAGNDTMIGGAGADLLYAAGGKDNLTGGGGADTFQFRAASDSSVANPDNVLDFAVGSDKIDLHLIDADSIEAGEQAFDWIGANAFTGSGAASAGELRVYSQSGIWYVEGDTNGDGAADFAIAVTTQGNAPLVQTDFLL